MQALAERSPDHSAHREDEPYRRALIGMYARLAATLRELTGTEALRHAVRAAGPLSRRPRSSCADLRIIEDVAAPTITARRWSRRACAPLIRAVQVFGFHLATVDLRQSSDKHEAVVAELLARRAHRGRLRRARRGGAATLLLRLLDDAAAAARARRRLLGRRRRASSRSSRPRARCAQRYGRGAIRHYIISHTETVSDLLEVLLLQKEAGPAARHARRRRDAAT